MKKILAIFSADVIAGQERLQGVYNYAGKHKNWIVVESNRTPLSSFAGRDEINEADGIICDSDRYAEIRRKRATVPIVQFCDSRDYVCNDENTFVLRTDNSSAGRISAESFLRKGLCHIAFIGVSDGSYSRERLQAFRDVAKKSNAELFVHDFRHDRGVPYSTKITGLRDFIGSLPKPCGVFTANDDLGRIVISSAEVLKIKVPDELAVIGADNHLSICRNTHPPLASIDMHFVDEGFRISMALDALLDGKKPDAGLSSGEPPSLVERISCDYAPADVAFISRARSIIRSSALGDVRIDAVARAVGVCRTILDREFKRVVGHTVNREIQLCRLEKMKEYLDKTDYTAEQIASVCGFTDTSYVKVFFKRETGFTMREWRLRRTLK